MPALPSSTKGKLVDTWTYAYKGADQPSVDEGELGPLLVKDKKVSLRVLLVKDQKALTEPPHLTAGVRFRVECDDPHLVLMGTDIEPLRKEAFALCDARYATKWEPWYLVEVIQNTPYQGNGGGFVFQYRDVHRGVAWDGTVLLKDREWNACSYESKITPWPGVFTNQRGRVIACIPATEANTAALKEFDRRIQELRKALEELLTPDTIAETLLHLSSLTLLPPATTEK